MGITGLAQCCNNNVFIAIIAKFSHTFQSCHNFEPNEYNLQTTITNLSDSGNTGQARFCHYKVIVGLYLMQHISNELK